MHRLRTQPTTTTEQPTPPQTQRWHQAQPELRSNSNVREANALPQYPPKTASHEDATARRTRRTTNGCSKGTQAHCASPAPPAPAQAGQWHRHDSAPERVPLEFPHLAQLIDDVAGHTLASASSLDAEVTTGDDGKVGVARQVGELIGTRASEAGIETAIFDRGGNRYAGRVKALAEAARDAGLKL